MIKIMFKSFFRPKEFSAGFASGMGNKIQFG